MSLSPRQRISLLAALAAVLVIALLTYRYTTPLPTRKSLPQPNGYDDFVKASRWLINPPNTSAAYESLSTEQLRTLVATNSEALNLIRAGLTHDSVISLAINSDYLALHMRHIIAFKQMAYLLKAEGYLAELAQRTNDAAQIYLTTMQFGQQSSREGVMIDRLIGIAIETIGFSALQKLTNDLPAKECREIARALEKFDAASESPEHVLDVEAYWLQHAVSLRDRIKEGIEESFSGQAKATKTNFVTKLNGHQQAIRQTMVIFAARAYELEKGQSPKSTSDLVPEYLRAVPNDPVTGNPLTHP